MNGHKFEYKCARMLRRKGFHHVEVTKKSGDQGVDIIAYKHFSKYAVQCKYYSYPVGNKAVQERSMPGANTMTATAASL